MGHPRTCPTSIQQLIQQLHLLPAVRKVHAEPCGQGLDSQGAQGHTCRAHGALVSRETQQQNSDALWFRATEAHTSGAVTIMNMSSAEKGSCGLGLTSTKCARQSRPETGRGRVAGRQQP
jgi:hypothetical protein